MHFMDAHVYEPKLEQKQHFVISTFHLQVWRGSPTLWFAGEHQLCLDHCRTANHTSGNDSNCSNWTAGKKLRFSLFHKFTKKNPVSLSNHQLCLDQDDGTRFPNTFFCDSFYVCINGTIVSEYCEEGLWFDQNTLECLPIDVRICKIPWKHSWLK